ncbi:hypothetical protein LSH36_88g05020 [Paralvinella palmiformis]|uniref:CD109 antigen n=1 Tax=Paralvinella palmiformis TaxID=53620 RepID=A0AAD9K1U8_9ANNE|nr:hypothetical protein LSH36_88g05020 [Paralvinella palmiformis]
MSSLFHVVLFSRGQIVSAQDMKMIDNTEHIYKLIVNEDIGKKLSPNCQMIVWTVTDADELLADSIQFSIDGAFSNQLQVSINPIDSQQVTPTEKLVRAKPGDEVTVRVKAKPLSYFGLLVVDQASRALGSNDITQKEVLSVLQSQDDDVSDYPWRFSFFDPVFFFRSSGARNSKEIIQNSGLFIKTDVYIDGGHVTSPPTSTYPEWPMGFMTTTFRPTKMEVPQIDKPDDELDKSPEIPKDRENADTHGLAEVKRIRKDFPETWIFLDGKVNSHGLFSTSSTVPDSITTWIATAFSIHPEKGLGVLDQPFELQAFKPFFVTMDLPYSIIRGEEFELKIIVQNYLKSSVDVKITLEKSKDYFKVSPPSGGKYQFAKVWTDIGVPPGDGYTVSIWIKPVELGNIPIEVKAQSSQMADAVLRKILVKPEGAPQEYTKNVLIQSKDITTFVEKVDVELPVDVLVPDSLRVYASLSGDIMGPAMNNLDHLIRMPYGCGEQNMLNFAPNIFIMDYLKATDQSNPKVVENAMKYSEIGYQKELNYQRKDGCFSAFGNSDKEGSTWLTAFVLKSFWRGRPYLSQSVNSDMEKGLKCLITKQTKSGQFVENGVIYHKAMQGGTSSGVTLTAYVLITLLEIKDIMLEDELSSSFTAAVSSAESYLMSKLNDPDIQNDPYTLAVVGYAFSLGNQGETTQRIFDSLKDLAKHENGQMYWDEKQQSSSPDKSEMWNYHKASTHKVEIAAYALLMYVKLDKYLDGLPITNWLIDQRNPNGGYRSTQDTVMALQALTEIAIRVYGDIEPSMDVTIERNVNEWSFPKLLTSDTQLLLQTLELDLPIQQHSELQVKAKGKGTALVQITVKYNIYRIKADTKIKLNVTSEEKVDGITNVNICTSYLGEGDSGMVVIETMPLSGYKFVDMENVRKSADELKRVEQNDDKTVLYLDTVKKDDICLQLTQERVNFVANIKKSRTLAYSYYDTDETDSVFYLPQTVNARSICDTCSECCSEKSDYVLHFDVERRINGVSGMAPMINITFPAFVCILFHYAVN